MWAGCLTISKKFVGKWRSYYQMKPRIDKWATLYLNYPAIHRNMDHMNTIRQNTLGAWVPAKILWPWKPRGSRINPGTGGRDLIPSRFYIPTVSKTGMEIKISLGLAAKFIRGESSEVHNLAEISRIIQIVAAAPSGSSTVAFARKFPWFFKTKTFRWGCGSLFLNPYSGNSMQIFS